MKISANKLGSLSVVPQTPANVRDVPRRIQITDGSLSLVAKGFGQLEKVRLPAGVYQARVESVEKPFEQMVFVAPGKKTSITYPVHEREVLPSAAPVPGADAMHEYMRDPLNHAVMRPATLKPCRIVVMATRQIAGPIDLSGFRFLDAKGREVTEMVGNLGDAEGNEWKIISRDVDEGGWILEWPAANFGPKKLLRQPLWCSKNWCTLIFVGVNVATGTPDMENVSIYFWRTGSSFAPEQTDQPDSWDTRNVLQSQRYTELALHSLVNGRSLLSIDEVDTNLLVEKFKNPMLGILGCHLLLQRTSKDAKLIRTVVANLDRLVPGDPDVMALEVMARRAGVKGLKSLARTLSWPPMLRKGFLALRDEDWLKPGTIAQGSVCDRVRAGILSGGVWTRWVGEKSREEFVAPTAQFAAVRKTAPAWKKLSNITGSPAPTSKNVLSYVKQFLGRGGKKFLAEDLRWTGMGREQATAVVRYMNEESAVARRPGIRKAAARISPKKVVAKKDKKTRSTKAPQASGRLQVNRGKTQRKA
jgi:hypothetical protein